MNCSNMLITCPTVEMACCRSGAKKEAAAWLTFPIIPVLAATNVIFATVAASSSWNRVLIRPKKRVCRTPSCTSLAKRCSAAWRLVRYSLKASLCCRARACCSKASWGCRVYGTSLSLAGGDTGWSKPAFRTGRAVEMEALHPVCFTRGAGPRGHRG